MKHFEEINNVSDVLATDFFEPEENSIQFTLIIGLKSEKPEDVFIDGKKISQPYRIYFDGENNKYRVYFETYICYSIINESYEQLGGKSFIGDKIRIYTDSNFLNYVKADTFASPVYPGEFKHYAFVTGNHIINVASVEEPTIEKLI